MDLKTLIRGSHIIIPNPRVNHFCAPHFLSCQSILQSSSQWRNSSWASCNEIRRTRILAACISPRKEILGEESEISHVIDQNVPSDSSFEEEEESVRPYGRTEELAGNESIWVQMVEIVKFSGPATGLWLCGPLMSLIDTAVIGQSSSIELAALGPGTVLCDYLSYVFMFLSIATSNLVATALARQDKDDVQHQISTLLFVGLTCGVLMFFFTRFMGESALRAFTGEKNVQLLPAANTYVQIRGLAWPAMLVGWVAQSASLGMKDSWGPLKALAVASAINGIGDVVLCLFLDYGISGAAWATMVSQVVAAYMMIDALKDKGYNGFAISVPSTSELLQIFMIAAPVFITMMSKVAFYSLLIFFATSMGTHTVAAHQVMVQIYGMFTVLGEPLSQTAQSFMPELMYGAKRSLSRARMLLKSLVIIGALSGLMLGSVGTAVPWLFPKAFSPDAVVIAEMHKVLIPYFIALSVTASTHSLEGTLLAGRDLKFISLSMSSVFSLGSLLLWIFNCRGFGLPGCWWTLALFQWARFSVALLRLTSPDGILYSEDSTRYQVWKLETV